MDIIERLKRHADQADEVGADCAAVCEPAIAEIERLRDALADTLCRIPVRYVDEAWFQRAQAALNSAQELSNGQR